MDSIIKELGSERLINEYSWKLIERLFYTIGSVMGVVVECDYEAEQLTTKRRGWLHG